MKKLKFILFSAFVLMSLTNYAQKADSISTKLLGKLIGTWQVNNETNAGRNITPTDQNKMHSIKFRLDAKYVLSQGTEKLDSGTFNTNEGRSTIYLQSMSDKDHLQEWKVDLKTNNSMTLTAQKGSKLAGVKYDCAKVKDGM